MLLHQRPVKNKKGCKFLGRRSKNRILNFPWQELKHQPPLAPNHLGLLRPIRASGPGLSHFSLRAEIPRWRQRYGFLYLYVDFKAPHQGRKASQLRLRGEPAPSLLPQLAVRPLALPGLCSWEFSVWVWGFSQGSKWKDKVCGLLKEI